MGGRNDGPLHRIQTSQDLSGSLRSKASEAAIAAKIKDAHKYWIFTSMSFLSPLRLARNTLEKLYWPIVMHVK